MGTEETSWYVGFGVAATSTDSSSRVALSDSFGTRVNFSSITLDEGDANKIAAVVGYNFSDYFGLQLGAADGHYDLFISGQITFPVWEHVSPLIDIGVARFYLENDETTFGENNVWSETVPRIGLGLEIHWESLNSEIEYHTLQVGYYSYGDVTLDIRRLVRNRLYENGIGLNPFNRINIDSASLDASATALEVRYLMNFE